VGVSGVWSGRYSNADSYCRANKHIRNDTYDNSYSHIRSNIYAYSHTLSYPFAYCNSLSFAYAFPYSHTDSTHAYSHCQWRRTTTGTTAFSANQ
jgi:hypothetical protein